jgi:hypothetical protein
MSMNHAAFPDDLAVLALLLRQGARWHTRNCYSCTALSRCLHAGCNEIELGRDHVSVSRLLLAEGAQLRKTTKSPTKRAPAGASPRAGRRVVHPQSKAAAAALDRAFATLYR